MLKRSCSFSLYFLVRRYFHLCPLYSFSLHFNLTIFDTYPKVLLIWASKKITCTLHSSSLSPTDLHSSCHIGWGLCIWIITFPSIKSCYYSERQCPCNKFILIPLWQNTLKIYIPDIIIFPNSFSDVGFENIVCIPIFTPLSLSLPTKHP